MSTISKVIFVTGASRGIGEAFVCDAMRRYDNCRVVGIARSDLTALADRFTGSESTTTTTTTASGAQFVWRALDLSRLDDLGTRWRRIVDETIDDVRDTVEQIVLVNNAGSLGPNRRVGESLADNSNTSASSKSNEIPSAATSSFDSSSSSSDSNCSYADLIASINLNVTSPMIVSDVLLGKLIGERVGERLTVVNISSGAAIRPYATWSPYCCGKAARRMLTQVLSAEEEERQAERATKPTVRTLNYSPGIIKTRMQEEIRDAGAPGAKQQWLIDFVWQKGRAAPASATAGVCFDILDEDTFESGTRIDLYDRRPDLIADA
jgi:NAD(P)-dependent dehydrogenase (short-subunit alcohol dehydrogenase family)